ncbi:MAG: dephospho-CoA kinase [Actinomycetota bacterium]|nr:dephospho-CoA kinase [Actinomycetota bacterium]
MARRIGLTGGIGSGKSTAAARFAALGATVIDSDVLAREVVQPGTPGLAAVVERFGPGILTEDGTLDRPKLGGVVFADGSALADLNAIVHPLVGGRTAELMAAAGERAVLVHDVPLLVENGLAGGFDAVVVVEAPLALRLSRLAARGLDERAARSRMAAQASDAQRRAVATVLLDNSGSVAELDALVDAAWARLIDDPAGES